MAIYYTYYILYGSGFKSVSPTYDNSTSFCQYDPTDGDCLLLHIVLSMSEAYNMP